ncbi:MAG: tyrosine decarboxylase MfnA [Promethearchaeota archaeon]
MRKFGLGIEKIKKILKEKVLSDCDFRSGYILGSMCTEPLEFGRDIYRSYMHINIGDKGISPFTSELEKDLIEDIGDLFHGKDIVGNFTSGGTESNIIALRIARKINKNIKKPEIIVSESAHLSFEKFSDLIGIKIVKAKLTPEFVIDIEDVRKKINKNTCGIVGIAGSTGLGLVDPISELSEIAEEKELFLHIDAAFGGFILPFMKELGYSIPDWDFILDGVNSITADPHKMGMGIIPTGTFLIRNDNIPENLMFKIPYLAGGAYYHFNITGTRPGASIISFWAIFNYLGMEGYKKIVQKCLQNTQFLKKRISEIDGVKLIIEPQLNVLGLTTEDESDISILNDYLKRKGWRLGEFKDLNFLRVVCMPHVKKEHLNKFCDDLEKVIKDIRK